MVKHRYTPSRGDLVWLNFTPQSGHEQAGNRPALVLSPVEYNRKTGLMIVCPITSRIKGYPFEVPVKGKEIFGVVLSDQVKNLDWRTREVSFIERSSSVTLQNTLEKLQALFMYS